MTSNKNGDSATATATASSKLRAPRLTAMATVTDRSDATAPATTRAVAFAPETQGDFPGFPTTTATTTPSQPRKKVPYEKGYSQQDWLRLTRSSTEDLTGNGGRPLGRKISLSEVAQHRTEDDAWMVLNGKVYNVTRYVKFHPGGVDYLMQGAGKDATRLFNKYHKWVNADFMLQKCFLGQVVK